jgi:hypothetical protein
MGLSMALFLFLRLYALSLLAYLSIPGPTQPPQGIESDWVYTYNIIDDSHPTVSTRHCLRNDRPIEAAVKVHARDPSILLFFVFLVFSSLDYFYLFIFKLSDFL